ncbi:DUF2752 domain-containing protein [Fusobacterium sp.]|uniref:DUF2752 domain-containing protein n=1 Tax=Fusobacterium sp. TaxID=68766 RepID=UPI002619D69E|nr:DUF2752 domain-containing protein [Fusobacterium sp.]
MRKKLIKIFIFIGILSIISNFLLKKSVCLFINIFGIPCPTCGITRAYISLLHLDIKSAFFYHPLFLLVPFIFFIKKKAHLFTIFILFLIVWVIRMYLYFPNVEPMIFNRDALYIKLFYFIKNSIINF